MMLELAGPTCRLNLSDLSRKVAKPPRLRRRRMAAAEARTPTSARDEKNRFSRIYSQTHFLLLFFPPLVDFLPQYIFCEFIFLRSLVHPRQRRRRRRTGPFYLIPWPSLLPLLLLLLPRTLSDSEFFFPSAIENRGGKKPRGKSSRMPKKGKATPVAVGVAETAER